MAQKTEAVSQFHPSDKEFATCQARFARQGHELTKSQHEATGLTLWQISRWGQARRMADWPSVLEFLAQLGG